jgi:hypothetical protein
MAKKKSGSAPSKSQSEDSVRSKITGIEGGLGSLTSSLQNMNANLMINNDYAESILHSHGELFKTMSRNIEIMAQAMLGLDVTDNQGNKVDYRGMKVQGGNAENIAEATKREEKRIIAEEEQTEEDKKQTALLESIHKDLRKGSILDILIGAAGLLAGFVTGLVGEYMRVFSKVLKPITSLFTKEGGILSKLITGLKSGFTKFVDFFVKLKALVTENTIVSKVIGVIQSGWRLFTGYLSGLGSLFGEITGLWNKLFGNGPSMLSKFLGYFKAIGQRLGIFFELGAKLGKLIGKIAIPIQVILSIFDTVTGALDGWNNTEGSYVDKFIAAVKGGITGLLNGLIGGLLDLLKDALSWILSAIGLDDASAALDSFSFQDLIRDAIDGLVEMVMTPVRMIEDLVKAFKGEMSWGDMFKTAIARMVVAIVKPFKGISKWIGFDIEQKALEMLGLPNPSAGGGVQSTGETGVATKALEKTTGENIAVKDEGAAKAALSGMAAGMSNSSQTIVNNNTNTAAIVRSKTTNWEPDDQWARGGMSWGA